MNRAPRIVLGFALAALSASAHAQAAPDEPPSVTPYRPSVSTPAALSAPGWLEAEIGGTHAHGGASKNEDSAPYTLKLAFSPDWGVRVGGDAWLRDTNPDGSRSNGIGDTQVVVKRRFGVDDASAFGVELGADFPTTKSAPGNARPDYSINGIYSVDSQGYHVDANLILTRLGAIDPGTGRTQTTWAAALSRQLDDQWGVVGELSGTRQAGAPSTSQLLVAASYTLSRSIALDVGVSRGFTSASTTWSIFSGVTVLVARLF